MPVAAKERSITHYTSLKDSGTPWLGRVPSHWELTRLGTRFNERRSKVSDKDYPPLSVTKSGILPQLEDAAKTNDGDNRKLVKKGDYVINSRSDRKGSSGISDRDGSVSLINIVITPSGIEPSFCQYLFKSYNFIEEYYRIGRGIVADLWTTRYDEMKGITLALPTEVEQIAIARFLDEKTTLIDKAISIKERQIELLKERRDALINKAVTKGLNPKVKMKDSGVEWIGQIPEHWEVLFNRRLFREESRKITKPNELALSLSQVDGVIPSEEMKERSLSPSHRNNFKLVHEKDLIVNRFKGHLGVFFESKYRGIVTFHYGVFKPAQGIITKYFELLYHSEGYKTLYAGASNGMSIGLQNLSNQNFYDIKSLVPPKDEQKSIVFYCENIVAKISVAISSINQEIEKLKEYKTILINSAVTGKIKVC